MWWFFWHANYLAFPMKKSSLTYNVCAQWLCSKCNIFFTFWRVFCEIKTDVVVCYYIDQEEKKKSMCMLYIRTSGHPVFWPSGHPAFWSSGYLVIQTFGHLIIRPSGYLTIRSSDHPVIRPSGYLVIQTSGHLIIRSSNHPVIKPSGDPTIQSSDHLVIQLFGHLVFWPSGLLDASKMSLLGYFWPTLL